MSRCTLRATDLSVPLPEASASECDVARPAINVNGGEIATLRSAMRTSTSSRVTATSYQFELSDRDGCGAPLLRSSRTVSQMGLQARASTSEVVLHQPNRSIDGAVKFEAGGLDALSQSLAMLHESLMAGLEAPQQHKPFVPAVFMGTMYTVTDPGLAQPQRVRGRRDEPVPQLSGFKRFLWSQQLQGSGVKSLRVNDGEALSCSGEQLSHLLLGEATLGGSTLMYANADEAKKASEAVGDRMKKRRDVKVKVELPVIDAKQQQGSMIHSTTTSSGDGSSSTTSSKDASGLQQQQQKQKSGQQQGQEGLNPLQRWLVSRALKHEQRRHGKLQSDGKENVTTLPPASNRSGTGGNATASGTATSGAATAAADSGGCKTNRDSNDKQPQLQQQQQQHEVDVLATQEQLEERAVRLIGRDVLGGVQTEVAAAAGRIQMMQPSSSSSSSPSPSVSSSAPPPSSTSAPSPSTSSAPGVGGKESGSRPTGIAGLLRRGLGPAGSGSGANGGSSGGGEDERQFESAGVLSRVYPWTVQSAMDMLCFNQYTSWAAVKRQLSSQLDEQGGKKQKNKKKKKKKEEDEQQQGGGGLLDGLLSLSERGADIGGGPWPDPLLPGSKGVIADLFGAPGGLLPSLLRGSDRGVSIFAGGRGGGSDDGSGLMPDIRGTPAYFLPGVTVSMGAPDGDDSVELVPLFLSPVELSQASSWLTQHRGRLLLGRRAAKRLQERQRWERGFVRMAGGESVQSGGRAEEAPPADEDEDAGLEEPEDLQEFQDDLLGGGRGAGGQGMGGASRLSGSRGLSSVSAMAVGVLAAGAQAVQWAGNETDRLAFTTKLGWRLVGKRALSGLMPHKSSTAIVVQLEGYCATLAEYNARLAALQGPAGPAASEALSREFCCDQPLFAPRLVDSHRQLAVDMHNATRAVGASHPRSMSSSSSAGGGAAAGPAGGWSSSGGQQVAVTGAAQAGRGSSGAQGGGAQVVAHFTLGGAEVVAPLIRSEAPPPLQQDNVPGTSGELGAAAGSAASPPACSPSASPPSPSIAAAQQQQQQQGSEQQGPEQQQQQQGKVVHYGHVFGDPFSLLCPNDPWQLGGKERTWRLRLHDPPAAAELQNKEKRQKQLVQLPLNRTEGSIEGSTKGSSSSGRDGPDGGDDVKDRAWKQWWREQLLPPDVAGPMRGVILIGDLGANHVATSSPGGATRRSSSSSSSSKGGDGSGLTLLTPEGGSSSRGGGGGGGALVLPPMAVGLGNAAALGDASAVQPPRGGR